MTDDEYVEACPFCDSSSVSHSQARADETLDRAWFCCECRRLFAEPDRRPGFNGNSPLTRKLIEMDPDDLPTRGQS